MRTIGRVCPGVEGSFGTRLRSTAPSYWEIETEPSERRKLLLSLFEQVWAQEGQTVAVQPHEDFLPYFQAASRCRTGRGNRRGHKSGSDGARTRDLLP
jgi:hypothetical protein